jgi:hypothetical protein
MGSFDHTYRWCEVRLRNGSRLMRRKRIAPRFYNIATVSGQTLWIALAFILMFTVSAWRDARDRAEFHAYLRQHRLECALTYKTTLEAIDRYERATGSVLICSPLDRNLRLSGAQNRAPRD